MEKKVIHFILIIGALIFVYVTLNYLGVDSNQNMVIIFFLIILWDVASVIKYLTRYFLTIRIYILFATLIFFYTGIVHILLNIYFGFDFFEQWQQSFWFILSVPVTLVFVSIIRIILYNSSLKEKQQF